MNVAFSEPFFFPMGFSTSLLKTDPDGSRTRTLGHSHLPRLHCGNLPGEMLNAQLEIWDFGMAWHLHFLGIWNDRC
jgi:hypothetical protein